MSAEHDDPTPPSEPPVDQPLDGASGADASSGPAATEERPSRKAAWLAMAAVALALGLIWVAPGVNDGSKGAQQGQGAAIENPGDPEDADITGKPAPLQFTLKDMNGVDVKLANFKGKVI